MIETLYQIHRPWLLHWCTALTRNPALAEDLVQDTFVKAIGHIAQLEELSPQQQRSWLRRTAQNRYIDLVRREKRAAEVEMPLPLWEDDHSRQTVLQLCQTLPEPERTLFWLRYFEGYNATELGELFALPPSTVRYKLASARSKLKKLYLAD